MRVADVALRDVPTCRVDENVRAVRDRVADGGWDVCVVVDDGRVVLGLITGENVDGDPLTPVDQVMDSGPTTFRPNVAVGTLPEYVKTQRIPRALVTTSDGVLIGLLPSE